MPSYNTGGCIARSIESVLDQTYRNWELLIVDDCSEDGSDEIAGSYTDRRIRYFRNQSNRGAAYCRNLALRKAMGRWIAFLDSDDLWHPDKLEKQIAFMEKNRYVFSYTNYDEIDSEGKHTGVTVTGPKRITKRGFYDFCWVGCLTVMYDAAAIGLIQIKEIRKNNDYAMWLKICRKADCYLLDETLASYRRGRSGSISSHSYLELVKWHYRLFRIAEGESPVRSLFYTLRNLVFGLYKKARYVRKAAV